LFSLDEIDRAILDSLENDIARKVDYILQLGYYRAIGTFFLFSFQKVKAYAGFILKLYFPGEPFPKKQVSKNHHYRNRCAVMNQFGLKDVDAGFQGQLLKEAKALAKRHGCPGESYHQLSSTIAKVSGGRMLSGKTEIELDINADSIRLIANAVIFYNATLLSALYQHYQSVATDMAKEILRFSPVAWQHINFIGKYEFYNRGDVLNIQEVIKNFTDVFKIDISSVSHM
jgi:hypothetical protein